MCVMCLCTYVTFEGKRLHAWLQGSVLQMGLHSFLRPGDRAQVLPWQRQADFREQRCFYFEVANTVSTDEMPCLANCIRNISVLRGMGRGQLGLSPGTAVTCTVPPGDAEAWKLRVDRAHPARRCALGGSGVLLGSLGPHLVREPSPSPSYSSNFHPRSCNSGAGSPGQ